MEFNTVRIIPGRRPRSGGGSCGRPHNAKSAALHCRRHCNPLPSTRHRTISLPGPRESSHCTISLPGPRESWAPCRRTASWCYGRWERFSVSLCSCGVLCRSRACSGELRGRDHQQKFSPYVLWTRKMEEFVHCSNYFSKWLVLVLHKTCSFLVSKLV